jgi:hypothetical protein
MAMLGFQRPLLPARKLLLARWAVALGAAVAQEPAQRCSILGAAVTQGKAWPAAMPHHGGGRLLKTGSVENLSRRQRRLPKSSLRMEPTGEMEYFLSL